MPEHTGQVAFYDAVFADPDMTDANKAMWLHSCAADYMARMRLCQLIMSGEINEEDLSAFLKMRDDLIQVPSVAVGEVTG